MKFYIFEFCMIILVSIMLSQVECSVQGNWNYEAMGPDKWFTIYSQCHGSMQSPIDINTTRLVYNKDLMPFYINHYNYTDTWNVTNTDKAITVYPGNPSRYQLTGSNLDTAYQLAQFHFHWGQNEYQGSEHFIDQHKFPLELHLVHVSPSGYAVLGFLFQLTNTTNQELEVLINAASSSKVEDTYKVITFNIASILPKNFDRYYRYAGSLTTPPCSETVLWTVFEEKINITVQQLEKFWVDHTKTNWRDPRPINSRTVYSSFPTYISSATSNSFNIFMAIVVFTAIIKNMFI